ncbi:MAG: hypothetical protein HPY81_01240 [Firmicutes bacterium]|nr:hypothetical protein [Bacillota bacterium]
MTSLSQGVTNSIGLRYPGHNTRGCEASTRLCRPVIEQAYGVETSALDASGIEKVSVHVHT